MCMGYVHGNDLAGPDLIGLHEDIVSLAKKRFRTPLSKKKRPAGAWVPKGLCSKTYQEQLWTIIDHNDRNWFDRAKEISQNLGLRTDGIPDYCFNP